MPKFKSQFTEVKYTVVYREIHAKDEDEARYLANNILNSEDMEFSKGNIVHAEYFVNDIDEVE
jgi:hypothetical protein